MNIYSVLNLLSAVTNLYFGFNIIILNPKNSVTKSFTYLCLSFIGWNLSIFYTHYVQSEFIFRLTMVFLFSIGFLFLEFVWKLINRPRDRILNIIYAVYSINIVLLVFTKTVISSWRITPYGIDVNLGPLFLPVSVTSGFILPAYGVYLVIIHKRKITNPIMKSALNIVISGILSIFLLIFFLDFLLITILNYTWVPSAASFSFIPALFFYIATKKYNFLLLKPETILPYFFDYLGDGAIILDDRGNIIKANHSLSALMKKDINLIGLNIKSIIKDFDETKDYKIYEFQYNNKILRISQTKIKNKDIVIGYALIIHDITERVEMERELEKAKQEAYQAMDAERRFLSNISHEMRTPLNAITATLDLVSQEGLTSTQKEYLSLLKTQTKILLEIINDILNISKIQEGKLTLERKEFNIREIFYETVEIVSTNIYKKGLEFYPYIDPNIPSIIIGDDIKLKEILINLLGNAAKFTEKGGIWLKIFRENIKDNSITLKFIVRDTGIGIPPDKINTIFDKFTQVDTSITRTYNGTGLGLSIVKEFVKMMDGDIKVESTEGKGATFSFSAKFKLPGCDYNDKPLTLEIGYKDAIIISKNTHTLAFLREILEDWYLNVKEVLLTEKDSAEKLKDTGIKNDTIILLDINEKEPENIMKILKKYKNFKNTFILGLVSLNNIHLLKEYKDIVTNYLLKPIRQDLLFNKIKNIKIEKVKKDENFSTDTYIFSDKYKVLLVEDNKINQRLEGILLEKMGISFDIANNGKEAVELFSKNSYDLILMDVQMPIMDGINATKVIREIEKKEKNKHTPIIALSASVFDSEIKKFLEAGMDGYITKPVSQKILYENIAKFLEDKKITHTKEEKDETNRYKIFDIKNLLEDLGDEDIIRELLDNNRIHIYDLISRFKEAKKKMDIKNLSTITHSLKGVLGNFANKEITKSLDKFEKYLKENNLSKAEEIYKEIHANLEIFLEETDNFLNDNKK